MNLEIVWRNIELLRLTEPRLERLVTDQYGALYAVRSGEETKVFELLPGNAA